MLLPMIMRALALFLLTSAAVAAPPEPITAPESLRVGHSAAVSGARRSAGADDCGLADALIPDFSLQDLNFNSTTFQQVYTRDDLLGRVLVMYWAQST